MMLIDLLISTFWYISSSTCLVFKDRCRVLTFLAMVFSGNRGSSRTPLDWLTRVRIALGAARGLAYIHAQGGSRGVHGNIKSSNILLNQDLDACISDFGLAQLLSSTAAASRIVGYRAPEITETRKVTQKSDVYSFGVVCLLTSNHCVHVWVLSFK